MLLLSSILLDPPRTQNSFLLCQSSIAQSSVPILRQILAHNIKAQLSDQFLLFCFIFPPSNIISTDVTPLAKNIQLYDWTGVVPEYDENWFDPRPAIISAVKKAPPGTIQVFIDSIDTLCSDFGSVTETYKFLLDLLNLLHNRSAPFRLILHATRPSEIVPLLTQPAYSRSLVQLISHPAVLLTHLAKEYLVLPPPLSSKEKFWATFLPLSERNHDVERLIQGAEGGGTGDIYEMTIDILIRGNQRSGKKRIVERELEGWSLSQGACDLADLSCLKSLWNKKAVHETILDPTQNASFNLMLTPSQQESRAQVPLPYAHEGGHTPQRSEVPATIFYDPDSADDIDDDDPDEDLDI